MASDAAAKLILLKKNAGRVIVTGVGTGSDPDETEGSPQMTITTFRTRPKQTYEETQLFLFTMTVNNRGKNKIRVITE